MKVKLNHRPRVVVRADRGPGAKPVASCWRSGLSTERPGVRAVTGAGSAGTAGLASRPSPGAGGSESGAGDRRGGHLGPGRATAATGVDRRDGLRFHRVTGAGLHRPGAAGAAHCRHCLGANDGLELGSGASAGDPGHRGHPGGGGVGEQGEGRSQLQERLRLPPTAGASRPDRRGAGGHAPARQRRLQDRPSLQCWMGPWPSCPGPPASRTSAGHGGAGAFGPGRGQPRLRGRHREPGAGVFGGFR